MSKTIVCKIPDHLLKCDSGVSDRFCFSRQFVPRDLRVIPMTRQADLNRILDGLQKKVDPAFAESSDIMRVPSKEVTAFQNLATQVRGGRGTATDWQKLVELLQTEQLRSTIRTNAALVPGRAKFGLNSSIAEGTTGTNDFDDTQKLLDLLKSELGYLFYDRTRIRPTIFQIGEHLYALSLAPGEEVTIEQKSWTKRDVSLEELLEREQTLDLELQSTFTTEIQESLDEVKKVDVGANGTLGGNLDIVSMLLSAASSAAGVPAPSSGGGGGPIGVNASIQPSIQLSDELTQIESTKKTYQQTNKLAAKYRSLHKTTFRVTTEVGAETTSRRTIRNPNRTTPINLHYFKILREHEVTHERYGARLCWGPWIKDPGANLRATAAQNPATQQNGSQATSTRPVPPELRQWKISDWSYPMYFRPSDFDAAGGLSISQPNRKKSFLIPDGWKWDGNQDNVKVQLNFPGMRSHHIEKDGPAWSQQNEGLLGAEPGAKWFVCQLINVGIACTRGTIFGKACGETNDKNKAYNNTDPPPILPAPVCNHMNCTTDEPVYSDRTSVQMRVGLNPVPTSEERAAQDKYQQQLAIWEQLNQPQPTSCLDVNSQSASVEGTSQPNVPSSFNPLSELMRRLVDFYFVPEVRDDYWEIEYCHRMFDWEDAAYTLYPGWWTGQPLPYPQLPNTHILNASWARLFVPVRPGYERLAMRWVLSCNLECPLSDATEVEIAEIMQELRQYRKEHFGDSNEELVSSGGRGELTGNFKVMGSWTEVLPTDGTHLEIIQSATTAADDLTATDLKQSQDLKAAAVADSKESLTLKKKATKLMKTEPSVSISVDSNLS